MPARPEADTVYAAGMVQGIVPVTGIVPENQPGVRLHEACGFQVVGVRERLGKLYGRWRDCPAGAPQPGHHLTPPALSRAMY